MEDFDPTEIIEAVERIRDAFNRAAEADSGAATPYFQRLARSMEKLKEIESDPSLLDSQDPMRLVMRMLPLVMDVRTTTQRLQQLAATDPKAAATLKTLRDEVQLELQTTLPKLGGLIGNLPKFPGMPDLGDFNRPQPPRPAPEAPKPAPAPKPKRKKGGDDYKL